MKNEVKINMEMLESYSPMRDMMAEYVKTIDRQRIEIIRKAITAKTGNKLIIDDLIEIQMASNDFDFQDYHIAYLGQYIGLLKVKTEISEDFGYRVVQTINYTPAGCDYKP